MKGHKLIPLVVVAAGLLAYHNSFTGAFVFDDARWILDNATIRHLWPIWQPLLPLRGSGWTVAGRPLINLSLAINYAVGGYNVWGYHALNLTVHILAGLTLLGVVRRTLLQPALRNRFGGAANELALATAVLWTVHPLQTESVMYILQRGESIMGLFYLLTLYCFIRGVESPLVARSTRNEPRAWLWYSLCVGACALGMASKEVMVSAPLMVLFYDRAFLSASFREAWRRRWPLYLTLASTWIVLGFVLVSPSLFACASISAQHPDHTWWQYLATLSTVSLQVRGLLGWTPYWWQYLATEPGVILYYLRLSVWPSPLCLIHPWPIVRTWMSILPPAVVIVSLLGASAWAWRTKPVWGFVGAWFFLILAPSSSFIPLPSPICEYRMYLSLAVVVSLVVMGLYSVAGRQSFVLFVVAAISLGLLTWRRNQDYRSEVTVWQDAVAKYPGGPSIHYNLGVGLEKAGRLQEAVGSYEQALRLKPDFAEAHYNLGLALLRLSKVSEAMGHWKQALQVKPDFAEAENNLGAALIRLGKGREAIRHYERVLRMRPDSAEAHNNFGNALAQVGRIREAIKQYEQALQLKPDYAEGGNNLAWLLATLTPAAGGDPLRSVALAQRSCEITGNRVAAYLDTLAVAYAAAGHFADAMATAQKAVELAYSSGQPQLAEEIETRLKLYRSGHVYRQPVGVSRQ